MPLETTVSFLERIARAEAKDATRELRDDVFNSLTNIGSNNGWVIACHLAVDRDDELWLSRYTSESALIELPWFLRLLHRNEANAEEDTKPLITGVLTAQSIA